MKNRVRLFISALSLSLLSAAVGTAALAKDGAFHTATTPAEKALAHVLDLSSKDGNLFSFVLNQPDRDQTKDVTYQGLFTNALLATLAERERKLVEESCGGVYLDGEICGIDYDPIACAQDYSDTGNLYRSDMVQPDLAVVSYTIPGELADQAVAIAQYRLVRRGEAWLIDSVRCSD
jgi:hypothetical protein